jgi:hypothetical protein
MASTQLRDAFGSGCFGCCRNGPFRFHLAPPGGIYSLGRRRTAGDLKNDIIPQHIYNDLTQIPKLEPQIPPIFTDFEKAIGEDGTNLFVAKLQGGRWS